MHPPENKRTYVGIYVYAGKHTNDLILSLYICILFYVFVALLIERKQFKAIQSGYEGNIVGIRKKNKSIKSDFFALLLFNKTLLNIQNVPTCNIKSPC